MPPMSGNMQQSQAQLELAAAATASERANRPRFWIVLASILLLAMFIYLLASVGSFFSSRSALADSRVRLNAVQRKIDAIAREEAQFRSLAVEADPDAFRVIEERASLAGLTGVRVSDTKSDKTYNERGLSRKRYQTSIKDADPTDLLEWLNLVMTAPDLQGLDIQSLVLTPAAARSTEQPGWNLDVEFGRWERRPGA